MVIEKPSLPFRKAGIAGGMDELRVQAYLEKLGVLDPLAAIRQGPVTRPGRQPTPVSGTSTYRTVVPAGR